MKKSILICGLALLGLTSCKKTWTCECKTVTTNQPNINQIFSIPDQRKSDAKTQCADVATQANNNAAYTISTFEAAGIPTGSMTQNTVCEIK